MCMKILIVGLGYVGSSIAVLLAAKHGVFALDKNKDRVDAVNAKRSPIADALMQERMQKSDLNLTATTDPAEAFAGADYIVIATNTPLDPSSGRLDTSTVESVVAGIAAHFAGVVHEADKAPVIIFRSTVPTGFTKEMQRKYPQFTFLFCPEFLREKTAMQDVVTPSRIIVGCEEGGEASAEAFANLMVECVEDKDVPVLFTSSEEAESIKLFSNSYLAMRVAFFNELDSFATARGLNAETMIHGVCLDPRIGDWYNHPSHGFGGACLPKDTRQLVADFNELPELIIRAAIEANELRKAQFPDDVE